MWTGLKRGLTFQLPLSDLDCDKGIGGHDELTAMIELHKATIFQWDLPERRPTTCAETPFLNCMVRRIPGTWTS